MLAPASLRREMFSGFAGRTESMKLTRVLPSESRAVTLFDLLKDEVVENVLGCGNAGERRVSLGLVY